MVAYQPQPVADPPATVGMDQMRGLLTELFPNLVATEARAAAERTAAAATPGHGAQGRPLERMALPAVAPVLAIGPLEQPQAQAAVVPGPGEPPLATAPQTERSREGDDLGRSRPGQDYANLVTETFSGDPAVDRVSLEVFLSLFDILLDMNDVQVEKEKVNWIRGKL